MFDDETGNTLVACDPIASTCEDGSPFTAAFLLIAHPDGSGYYSYAASDVCGSGDTWFGCAVNANGDDTACGPCAPTTDGSGFACSAGS